jgi:hypothetical protein
MLNDAPGVIEEGEKANGDDGHDSGRRRCVIQS